MPEFIRLSDVFQKAKLPVQILTVHDRAAASLKEVDQKTRPLKDLFWQGRELPFPVLLDKDNATATRYGVRAWPTTLLIDPSGKLVGAFHDVNSILKRLPSLPEDAVAQAMLGSTHNWGFSGDVDVLATLKSYCEMVGLQVEIDAGLKDKALPKVPFDCGPGPSLRTWFTAMLEPLGLDFDVTGRTITIRKAGTRRGPSPEMRFAAKRISKAIAKKVDLDFEGELHNFLVKLSALSGNENVVPDPLGRMQGRIDLNAKVAIHAKRTGLQEAADRALKPLGLQIAIRNESIYVRARKAPSLKRPETSQSAESGSALPPASPELSAFG